MVKKSSITPNMLAGIRNQELESQLELSILETRRQIFDCLINVSTVTHAGR